MNEIQRIAAGAFGAVVLLIGLLFLINPDLVRRIQKAGTGIKYDERRLVRSDASFRLMGCLICAMGIGLGLLALLAD